MILVTSANGRTGRSVVRALVARGHRVRALDIDPAVEELADASVEVVVGDMLDSARCAEATAGARAVVHIGPPMHPREAEMGHVVVLAARQAQIEHFVQFSVTHPQLEPLLNHQAKLAVERHVLLSRLQFTILQPMHYMQNIDVARVTASGRLLQPYDLDISLAHVDLEDVADVASLVVLEPAHFFATYELCGSDFLSGRQIAATISEVARIPVAAERRAWVPTVEPQVLPVSAPTAEEDYRHDAMTRLFDHYGCYGITGNPNVLGWLLGRLPTTFAEYVRRCLDASEAPSPPPISPVVGPPPSCDEHPGRRRSP
jgi:uncharacterized protein YbjT (DUF2867 family)